MPPEPIARELLEKAIGMRDEMCAFLDTLTPDDTVYIGCYTKIDEFNESLERIGQWLRRAAE